MFLFTLIYTVYSRMPLIHRKITNPYIPRRESNASTPFPTTSAIPTIHYLIFKFAKRAVLHKAVSFSHLLVINGAECTFELTIRMVYCWVIFCKISARFGRPMSDYLGSTIVLEIDPFKCFTSTALSLIRLAWRLFHRYVCFLEHPTSPHGRSSTPSTEGRCPPVMDATIRYLAGQLVLCRAIQQAGYQLHASRGPDSGSRPLMHSQQYFSTR